MKSLYLRIYATLVVVLLLFASASGWIFQRHIEQERARSESLLSERMGAWAELIQRSLPGADAPTEDQAAALREWSQRLRLPLALDDARRPAHRRVRVVRAARGRQGLPAAVGAPRRRPHACGSCGPARCARRGVAPRPRTAARATCASARGRRRCRSCRRAGSAASASCVVLIVLFIAVAAGAFPVVRRLTRRLEALKQGVEQFGAGRLDHRVAVSGNDEVAAVAASFNVAAARIEALVRSHQSLLANASHELRSPLARMKMAVSMLDDATPPQRERLKREIDTNVGELDALVEEVLLASRLDAAHDVLQREPIDLLGLAVEEGARVDAAVDGVAASFNGDERLLRRALRNLLENARRYGGDAISVHVGNIRGRPARSSCASATAAPACPKRCASASSSRSSACPAMPSRPAASAWA